MAENQGVNTVLWHLYNIDTQDRHEGLDTSSILNYLQQLQPNQIPRWYAWHPGWFDWQNLADITEFIAVTQTARSFAPNLPPPPPHSQALQVAEDSVIYQKADQNTGGVVLQFPNQQGQHQTGQSEGMSTNAAHQGVATQGPATQNPAGQDAVAQAPLIDHEKSKEAQNTVYLPLARPFGLLLLLLRKKNWFSESSIPAEFLMSQVHVFIADEEVQKNSQLLMDLEFGLQEDGKTLMLTGLSPIERNSLIKWFDLEDGEESGLDATEAPVEKSIADQLEEMEFFKVAV